MPIAQSPSTQKLFTSRIKEIAHSLDSYTLSNRHYLHSIPELGWEEVKTLAFIKGELETLCKESVLPMKIEEKEGGIWVDFDPYTEGKRLLFRADIDALPLEEATDLPFTSTHEGVMHACGHDCHTAMLLSACKAIATGLIRPTANLRLVWQRAEEFIYKKSGGEKLVQEGVCFGVDAVYALHIGSTIERGLFSSKPGVFMANTSQLHIHVECSGGHVMSPHLGSNAIDITTDIHVALRHLALTAFGPNHPISFVPSISKAGTAPNIRPNSSTIVYAIRNFFSPDELSEFISIIEKKVQAIVNSYATASVTFDWIRGYPKLCNDPKSYQTVSDMLENHNFPVKENDLLFSGEDFTYYLGRSPGSFWSLGAKQGPGWDHHTALFNPDESVLWMGVAFWLFLASDASIKH